MVNSNFFLVSPPLPVTVLLMIRLPGWYLVLVKAAVSSWSALT
ncbi:MAG: hypothetical protein QM683_05515 [Lacrimispora sp.]